ncbi:hypothetical protein B0H14DRAFT_3783559 [Mycena olivaceomarginata]|nr:hypothetical protein B0H14DRAFT_3783559 [Mycena olivaceomarginata]
MYDSKARKQPTPPAFPRAPSTPRSPFSPSHPMCVKVKVEPTVEGLDLEPSPHPKRKPRPARRRRRTPASPKRKPPPPPPPAAGGAGRLRRPPKRNPPPPPAGGAGCAARQTRTHPLLPAAAWAAEAAQRRRRRTPGGQVGRGAARRISISTVPARPVPRTPAAPRVGRGVVGQPNIDVGCAGGGAPNGFGGWETGLEEESAGGGAEVTPANIWAEARRTSRGGGRPNEREHQFRWMRSGQVVTSVESSNKSRRGEARQVICRPMESKRIQKTK